MRGFFAGALALLALQVFVTSPNTKGIGALAELPGAWARKFLDPTVPAIAGGGSAAPPAKAQTSSVPSLAAPSPTAVPAPRSPYVSV